MLSYGQYQRRRFERWLRAFPFLETTRSGIRASGRNSRRTSAPRAGDAIIAATEITKRAALFTLDRALGPLAAEGLELL